MTSRFAWLTVCLVGGTAVLMLLVELAFLPSAAWETFVPLATLAGAAAIVVASTAVELMGHRLARPLRRMVSSIDAGEVGDATLREFADQAPAEVAPLLYALHRAQAGLRGALASSSATADRWPRCSSTWPTVCSSSTPRSASC